jgi:hypothetical protein
MKNWHKLYKEMTSDERLELLEAMLEKKEALVGLRAWPFVNRRVQAQHYHLLGDRRQTLSQLLLAWLPGFDERPTPQRTRFFMFSAALGMTAVIASALASLPRQPGLLYSIPAYAVLVVLVMLQRQRKVEMLAA